MDKLVILGAGGFACEASLMVEEINRRHGRKKWNLLGFIDEDQTRWGSELRGYKVLGGFEVFSELSEDVLAICVVGEPKAKEKLVGLAEKQNRRFVNLVHPQVELAGDVKLGRGVFINKGCLFTTCIAIGDHVSINPGCGIGHDAVIEDYATLLWRVNISGNVKVGKGSLLGSGATVLQEKQIGSWSTVGAGAVVTVDLPDGCTAAGIPARVIKG